MLKSTVKGRNREQYCMNMKTVSVILALVIFATSASAIEKDATLACIAGASAQVDAGKSGKTDASSIRFLLTLFKGEDYITEIHLKYGGSLESMPTMIFYCMKEGDLNLISCSNPAGTIWYYPLKKHGLHASLSLASLFEEKRANSGEILNYSCSDF